MTAGEDGDRGWHVEIGRAVIKYYKRHSFSIGLFLVEEECKHYVMLSQCY